MKTYTTKERRAFLFRLYKKGLLMIKVSSINGKQTVTGRGIVNDWTSFVGKHNEGWVIAPTKRQIRWAYAPWELKIFFPVM